MITCCVLCYQTNEAKFTHYKKVKKNGMRIPMICDSCKESAKARDKVKKPVMRSNRSEITQKNKNRADAMRDIENTLDDLRLKTELGELS